MSHLELIKQLDHKPDHERLQIIIDRLRAMGVDFLKQEYATGVNLIVDLGSSNTRIGIGSHFDIVKNSGGANDNGSAIAVCLEIIQKFIDLNNSQLGLRIFFFDEEETGLKGSTAYVTDKGISELTGLINMELVGIGDKFALWPVQSETHGVVLETFEKVSSEQKIESKRFDKIVTNTSDHVSFKNAGLKDSFTVTCISDIDIEIAEDYYKALALKSDRETLVKILSE